MTGQNNSIPHQRTTGQERGGGWNLGKTLCRRKYCSCSWCLQRRGVGQSRNPAIRGYIIPSWSSRGRIWVLSTRTWFQNLSQSRLQWLLFLLSSSDVSVFGKEGFLVPRNTRQYLFKITPLYPLHDIQISGKVGVTVMMCILNTRCFRLIPRNGLGMSLHAWTNTWLW